MLKEIIITVLFTSSCATIKKLADCSSCRPEDKDCKEWEKPREGCMDKEDEMEKRYDNLRY